MKKKLFTSLNPQETIDNLEAECTRTEDLYPFFKTHSEQERKALEQELIEKIKEIESLSNKLSPLKKDVKTLSAELHAGGKSVAERVYLFVDLDNEVTGIYSDRGELIDKRAISPQDRQLTIE